MGLTVGQKVGLYRERSANHQETTARRGGGGGGGSILMWAGICGDKLIGPYKVDDGVKLTSQTLSGICLKVVLSR